MQKIHSLVKNRKYTVHEQLSSLRACFKSGRFERRHNGFTWWFEVTPTPLSDTYLLKIVYNQHAVPLVYVEEPKPLLLAKGAKTLPHTYNTKTQQLCLFMPKRKEWTSSMLISKTIVHWAIERLYYYEEWAYSGRWYGGGHGKWDVMKS